MTTLELSPELDPTEAYLERGWGDGLPIVPPTVEVVDAYLAELDWDPQETLGAIPPSWDAATRRAVVVNAVMAGCRVEEIPLVAAAIEACQNPDFNLFTVQTTTSPVAPLLLYNGSYARALGMNAGAGAMGPGDRVSATVGRAVRFVLSNVGAAAPGKGDRATIGLPAKFSWCTREHEEASPWEPFHVAAGFGPDDDAVTVLGGHGMITVCDPGDVPPEQVMAALAGACIGVGTNLFFRPGGQVMLLLAPEHAQIIATEGWTRSDVQTAYFEQARQSVGQLRRSGYHPMRDWPEEYDALPDSATIPVVADPADVLVAIVGGPGRYSHVVPTHGASGRSSTIRVTL